MCGLLGVYSKTFSSIEYELFRHLLFMNVLRGEDSTGIIRVGKDYKLRTRKSLLAAPEFLKSESAEICTMQKGGNDPLLLMGHTRHATKGKVTLKNAHPFKFPKVIGMHNGTIHNTFKHRSDYETDSEALYRNINDDGLEKALNEVEAYDTAYALQFIDTQKGTLNFIKNSRRPLYFTHIYAGTTLIWSSEKQVLDFIVNRKNLTPIGWDGDKDSPYFTLEDYDLLTLKLGDKADESKITSVDVEKKVHTTTTTTTGHGGQKSQTHTSSTTQGSLTDGEWIKTDKGYKFIPKKGNLSLIVDNTDKSKNTTSVPAVTSKKTKTESDSASTLTEYEDFKDRFGPEELSRLSWLQPVTQKKAGKKEVTTNDDNEVVEECIFEGYQGERITEKELRYHLSNGCFSCGEVFNLDDPHDFNSINGIHWGGRDFFACHECYENSDADWVRMTVDNTWPEASSK